MFNFKLQYLTHFTHEQVSLPRIQLFSGQVSVHISNLAQLSIFKSHRLQPACNTELDMQKKRDVLID